MILGAGSQANFQASKSEVNVKMAIFDSITVEQRAVGMADTQMIINMCIGWHGTFMDVATLLGWPSATRMPEGLDLQWDDHSPGSQPGRAQGGDQCASSEQP